MKQVKHVKKRPRGGEGRVLLIVLGDILLAGMLLVVFALFHHVLPIWRQRAAAPQLPAAVVTAAPATPSPAPLPVSVEEPPPEEPSPTPDLRTEWQIKFAEHFTDTVVQTGNSYSSPWVSVTLTEQVVENGSQKAVCHVADIYIGSLSCFRTYLATGEFNFYATQDVQELAAASGAIVAINGDFCGYQPDGVMVRHGQWYREYITGFDLCALLEDGSVETYRYLDRYSIPALKEKPIRELWCFGPALLDESGQPYQDFNMSRSVSYINPRCALGYYEPGHYCFVVVDGRQDGYSDGMTMPQLAQFFADLGCAAAYNMDGGGSAVMTFGDELVSRQSNGNRELSDILLIGEAEEGAA